MKISKEVFKEVDQYDSADQFLRAGGLSIELLDIMAFGFNEELKTIMPNQLNIKWKDDWNNVKWEVEKSGLSKVEWSKKIDLSEPIDVSYENGKFWVEDGHHRTYAAKVLKKPLNMNLEIKDKPIQKLGYDSYDQFMIDLFNKAKSIALNESLIKKILIEAITELPQNLTKLNGYGKYDINVNSVFKNNYSPELVKIEGELEDNYGWQKANVKYGTNFMNTGVIKVTIPVSEIYPGQKGLESKNLLKILNLKNISTLPQAVKVKFKNKYYIVLIDGHHRVASEILKGKNSVELLLKVDNFI